MQRRSASVASICIESDSSQLAMKMPCCLEDPLPAARMRFQMLAARLRLVLIGSGCTTPTAGFHLGCHCPPFCTLHRDRERLVLLSQPSWQARSSSFTTQGLSCLQRPLHRRSSASQGTAARFIHSTVVKITGSDILPPALRRALSQIHFFLLTPGLIHKTSLAALHRIGSPPFHIS
jgi:hypothetical protein